MTVYSTTIAETLDAGETERWVIPTLNTDAIRVELSGDAQPFDVDIQTAEIHNDVSSFDPTIYDSVFPNGVETIRDTAEHTIATDSIDRSLYVEVTNNSGGPLTVSGTIAKHGTGADQTVIEFIAAGTGNRPRVWVDGQGVAASLRTRFVAQDLTAADAPQPDDSATYATHDGSGTPAAGLYRSDSANSQWVKVEDNTVTIAY